MIEPVELEQFFLGVVSSALVVLTGALYALLFALARLAKSTLLLFGSYASYTALLVSTLLLAKALNLTGFWQGVVLVMLIGYLLAPQAIWHLCVGTHARLHDSENAVVNLTGRNSK